MTITNSTAIALRLAAAGPAASEKYTAEEKVNRLTELESTMNQILCENAAFTHNDKTLEENLEVVTSHLSIQNSAICKAFKAVHAEMLEELQNAKQKVNEKEDAMNRIEEFVETRKKKGNAIKVLHNVLLYNGANEVHMDTVLVTTRGIFPIDYVFTDEFTQKNTTFSITPTGQLYRNEMKVTETKNRTRKERVSTELLRDLRAEENSKIAALERTVRQPKYITCIPVFYFIGEAKPVNRYRKTIMIYGNTVSQDLDEMMNRSITRLHPAAVDLLTRTITKANKAAVADKNTSSCQTDYSAVRRSFAELVNAIKEEPASGSKPDADSMYSHSKSSMSKIQRCTE